MYFFSEGKDLLVYNVVMFDPLKSSANARDKYNCKIVMLHLACAIGWP